MFCKNCGKQIDEDCKFCPSCGIKINNTEPLKPICQTTTSIETTESTDEEEPHKSHVLSNILTIVGILVTAFVIFVITILAMNWDTLFMRDARNSDIETNYSSNFTLKIEFELTPRENIEDLEIEIIFSNSKRHTLTTRTEFLGNVEKGKKYTISYSLSEFINENILDLRYLFIRVKGGKVFSFEKSLNK